MLEKKIVEQLQKELEVSNKQAVPVVDYVAVTVGVGKQRDDKNFLEAVRADLQAITGQHPQERRARKAIAGFNVRQGNLVGYRVTLRGKRMEDYVKRFVNTTLPRVRDFRGVPLSSFDGHGNLTIGLPEQLAFPEINPEKTDVVFGVQTTLVTTAASDAEGEALLRALGFPLVANLEELDFST